jgi:hypothetical protein
LGFLGYGLEETEYNFKLKKLCNLILEYLGNIVKIKTTLAKKLTTDYIRANAY